MQYFDRDNPPAVPRDIAVCPICEADLIIEDIDEYEIDTGRVTQAGFHINCSTAPELDPETFTGQDLYKWREWLQEHFNMVYVDWLPVERVVFEWFDARYRLAREGGREAYAGWPKNGRL